MEIILFILVLVLVIGQLAGMAIGKSLKNEAYSILVPPVIVGALIAVSFCWLLLDAKEFGRVLLIVFSLIVFFVGCTASLLIAAAISFIKSSREKKC